MIASANVQQWPLIPTNAFLYFPEGNQIKQGSGEKQWRKIFQNGQPYDDFQNKKLIQLEKKLEELKIIAHQWFDKANKLRFLQANKFNISDTFSGGKIVFQQKRIHWPQLNSYFYYVRQNSGTIYYCGRDNQYRPILIVQVTKMREYQQQVIHAILNIVLQFTIQNLLIPGQVQNYVLIINLDDAGISDKSVVQKIVGFTGNTYRSRLYASYLLNTPFIINAGWNAFASNFVSQNTRKKIKISKQQFHQDMWTHIDKNIIQRKYGGNMNVISQNFWPPSQKLMNFSNSHAQKAMKLKTTAQYNHLYKDGILKDRKVKFSLLDKQPIPQQKQLLLIQTKNISQIQQTEDNNMKGENNKKSTMEINNNNLSNLLPKERIKIQNLPNIRIRKFKLFFQEQKFQAIRRTPK